MGRMILFALDLLHKRYQTAKLFLERRFNLIYF